MTTPRRDGSAAGPVASASAACDLIEAADAALHAFVDEPGRRAGSPPRRARPNGSGHGPPNRRRCTGSRSASRTSCTSTGCPPPPDPPCPPRR
ncbi:hypothetical protein NKH77_45165 [Streptomyces sp. M19]